MGRPGRRLAERDAGPSTYENAAQITRAGNYGWPYCMGNKQAYRDRSRDAPPRTDERAGYVSGGPATGGTDGWYDCDNLVNDSPNNTGLVGFPHQTGTGADAGKVRRQQPLVLARQPGRRTTAARASRASAAPTTRRTTARRRRSCARTRRDGA